MALEEISSYEKYGKFITQEGISFYNDICGKVNSFMNLYCQKNKENKNLYKLRKLHKQILCIADTSYEVPYKFESDEEVYQSVNGFLDNISSKHIVDCVRLETTITTTILIRFILLVNSMNQFHKRHIEIGKQ